MLWPQNSTWWEQHIIVLWSQGSRTRCSFHQLHRFHYVTGLATMIQKGQEVFGRHRFRIFVSLHPLIGS